MAVLIALLTACASTRIEDGHPLVREAPESEVAKVYFIRPRTERTMGFADNRLPVEADRFHLMTLAKGEYTMVPMVPGTVWISVTSMTHWGPRNEIKEMSRSRQFEFKAGETYFIVFNLVDGEFRGAFFLPEAVDIYTARELTRNMLPVGRARQAPVSSLEG
ncbi:MAG TPA: hypothetical protein ENK29_05695 [Chromatiales bacterium]|nr:hypothetical protein [Chromatiales bacterium]